MLASFFRFCQRNELISKNPMDALKKPKTPDVVPTDYFLHGEFERIIGATDKYEFGGGNDCEFRGLRLRAMSLLMRWAGLSILDATKLERAALSRSKEDGNQIFLYCAKTGVPVYGEQSVEYLPAEDSSACCASFAAKKSCDDFTFLRQAELDNEAIQFAGCCYLLAARGLARSLALSSFGASTMMQLRSRNRKA